MLNFAVAAVAVIAIVGAVSSYFEKYLTTSVSQWVGHDLRRTLYHHIQRLSLAEHDKTRTGDLITRVTSDIEAVQDFIKSALLGILVDVMTLAGMIGVMFYLNWRFTLIALSVAPVLFRGRVPLHAAHQEGLARGAQEGGRTLSVVEEVLTPSAWSRHLRAKTTNRSDSRRRAWPTSRPACRPGASRPSWRRSWTLIVAVGTCLVLWYGARLAMTGSLSAGVLIVFLMYLGNMYKPMRDLSKMTDTVSKAMVGYERIQEVLDIESVVQRPARRTPGPEVHRSDRVPERQLQLWRPTSEASRTSASRSRRDRSRRIVGPSGAGKTSSSA